MKLSGKEFVFSHELFFPQINHTGLKILRVINEPTAAAMAYGLHKVDVFHVLVIDLGGGTLDVSLLNKQGGMFLTRAMSGKKNIERIKEGSSILTYLMCEVFIFKFFSIFFDSMLVIFCICNFMPPFVCLQQKVKAKKK